VVAPVRRCCTFALHSPVASCYSRGNMPNRETHASVGLVSGMGYAAFEAKGQPTLNVVAEMAGGALGGYWGGQLPDWVEPALHSWHRSIAHSGVVGATVTVHARSTFISWQEHCRKQAESCRVKREAIPMVPHPSQPNLFVPAQGQGWQHFLLTIEEWFWHVAAGFANGFAAGYVSHLALDAFTPRSIPLLVSGF
jgi:hypothetical protein